MTDMIDNGVKLVDPAIKVNAMELFDFVSEKLQLQKRKC